MALSLRGPGVPSVTTVTPGQVIPLIIVNNAATNPPTTFTTSAGSFASNANDQTFEGHATLTAPTAGGFPQTLTITDSTAGNGQFTTITCDYSFTCSPGVCPYLLGGSSSFNNTVVVIFRNPGAWPSLPTITPSAGSLGTVTRFSNDTCAALFTPPTSQQTVTFTDGTTTKTCQIVCNALNEYTYLMSEVLSAGIHIGRPITLYRWNAPTAIAFSFSAPYAAVYMEGTTSNNQENWAAVSGSGNPLETTFGYATNWGGGSRKATPLYSNSTEAQYNVAVTLASTSFSGGWSIARGTEAATVAMRIYTSASSKPTISRYTYTDPVTGFSETFAAAPSPLNAGGFQSQAGNTQYSPPIMSGNFTGTHGGYTSLWPDNQFAAQAGTAPYGRTSMTNAAATSLAPFSYGEASITGKLASLYMIGSIYNPTTTASTKVRVVGGVNVEIDGVPLGTFFPPSAVPITDNFGNVDQVIPICHGLDPTTEHVYTVRLCGDGHIDRLFTGPTGQFTNTAVPDCNAWLAFGASQTQGGLCWESGGSQATSFAGLLANRTGTTVFNAGFSGNKITQYYPRLPGVMYQMPILRNRRVGTGWGGGQVATITISSGLVTAATTGTSTAFNSGGKNYPTSGALVYFVDAIGAGSGAWGLAGVNANGTLNGSVTILNQGNGLYVSTTVQGVILGNGQGVLNQGWPDWITIEDTINDVATTTRQAGQALAQAIFLLLTSTYDSPVLNIFWWTPFTNPWITNAGTFINNNDYLRSAQQNGSLNTRWGLNTNAVVGNAAWASTYNAHDNGLIFLSDQTNNHGLTNGPCGLGTPWPTNGHPNAPPGYFASNHYNEYAELDRAGFLPSVDPGILPDFCRMMAFARGR